MDVLSRINRVSVVKNLILRQMDFFHSYLFGHFYILASPKLQPLRFKEFPVIGQCHMHIGALIIKRIHKRSRHISQTSSFGSHLLSHISHTFWQISDFWSDHQNPWFFLSFHTFIHFSKFTRKRNRSKPANLSLYIFCSICSK